MLPTGSISWLPDSVGDSDVFLEVRDGRGGSVSQSFRVRVEEMVVPNRAPVADAGPDQDVTAGTLVLLDGRNSSDPDGDLITYLVGAPAGSSAALDNPLSVVSAFNPDLPRDYLISLKKRKRGQATFLPLSFWDSVGRIGLRS